MIRKREGIKRTSGAIGSGVESERAAFILTERKSERRKAELPKNGGEILRDRLKSRIKKSAGSEKNEEKGRYAKRIKPRKTMI